MLLSPFFSSLSGEEENFWPRTSQLVSKNVDILRDEKRREQSKEPFQRHMNTRLFLTNERDTVEAHVFLEVSYW